MDIPDFNTEITHLMGCLGMDKATLRDEILTHLQQAYIKGNLTERKNVHTNNIHKPRNPHRDTSS